MFFFQHHSIVLTITCIYHISKTNCTCTYIYTCTYVYRNTEIKLSDVHPFTKHVIFITLGLTLRVWENIEKR